LGVAGAALSNIISQVLGAIILLVVLARGRSRLKIAWADLRPDPAMIWRIVRIGIPALLMNVQRSLGNLLITFFIAPFGTLAIAAHSLATRIELFITMPTFGLGMGAGVLVGQNLGAHLPQRAEKSAWLATAIVEAFLLACSIAILVWANSIMSIFTPDPSLISLGALFMRIAAAAYTVLAVSSVLQSCIAGAGDTLPNMIISIAAIWLVQIPLAILLPRVGGLGVYGVRWAIVAATFVGSTAYWLYFRSGRWKTKKV
jgi:putative MATE family efflux protein